MIVAAWKAISDAEPAAAGEPAAAAESDDGPQIRSTFDGLFDRMLSAD